MRRPCPNDSTWLSSNPGVVQRWLWTSLLAAVVTIAGCSYGEVTPVTYEYAKALYSITNRKDATRLDQVHSQVETALAQQELSEREARWLHQIVEDAAAGRWEKANRAARQMMEDQLK